MGAITIQRKKFEEVDLSKYQGVWIVAEIKDENVRKVSFELLGKAIELANELKQEPCVLLIGNNVKRFSQEFSNRGAKKIYIAEHEALKLYNQADNMLDKFLKSNCGCSGNNYIINFR